MEWLPAEQRRLRRQLLWRCARAAPGSEPRDAYLHSGEPSLPAGASSTLDSTNGGADLSATDRGERARRLKRQ